VNRRIETPGQEFRVRLDVVYEVEHLAGRVLDYGGAGDALHELEFFMSIVQNRKAFHDYFVEERYEAGIALEGWEVKAIRGGRAQIGEGYVIVKGEELFLIGAHISPLPTVSTHFTPDPTRTRKLLMHAEEIRRLIGKVVQRGYTLVPLNLHFAKGRIKLEVGLARGKLQHDKRADERDKDWKREKQRLLRSR
jgi:SsrA-binding protein